MVRVDGLIPSSANFFSIFSPSINSYSRSLIIHEHLYKRFDVQNEFDLFTSYRRRNEEWERERMSERRRRRKLLTGGRRF